MKQTWWGAYPFNERGLLLVQQLAQFKTLRTLSLGQLGANTPMMTYAVMWNNLSYSTPTSQTEPGILGLSFVHAQLAQLLRIHPIPSPTGLFPDDSALQITISSTSELIKFRVHITHWTDYVISHTINLYYCFLSFLTSAFHVSLL